MAQLLAHWSARRSPGLLRTAEVIADAADVFTVGTVAGFFRPIGADLATMREGPVVRGRDPRTKRASPLCWVACQAAKPVDRVAAELGMA